MFDLWKLQRQQKKLRRDYASTVADADERNANDEDRARMEFEYQTDAQELDYEIQSFKSNRLVKIAIKIDARLPASEDRDFWVPFDPHYGRQAYLNVTGRDLVKTRIKEIKDRDFDDWAKWVKLLTPAIAALVGIIGALTGLVAVLQHKK